MSKKILVTGAAGFIGAAVCKKLLANEQIVLGIDNLNNYYDVGLKMDRIDNIRRGDWDFRKIEICEERLIQKLFEEEKPTHVIHLAAQAGVRYSIENPNAYIQSNLVGFGHILEGCRNHGIKHLVYASSSSVYGGNTHLPFKESQSVDHPVSLYAATKKANELMAHTYSHLYDLPATGLRFFTVYGPWGRPDMAPMLFAKAILEGKPIRIFNNGEMQRDFTYIDDIVNAITLIINKPATGDTFFDKEVPNPARSWAKHRVFNIGNSQPIQLMTFIDYLEKSLGVEAKKIFEPMQAGDVVATFADTYALEDWIGFKPSTSIEEGVTKFSSWYREYYKI